MIELTMSRVCLFVCGAVMLAAVAAPFSGALDDREAGDMTECADRIAAMLDTFWSSETDVMTLRSSEILPGPSSSISLDGHRVVLISDGLEYTALSEAVSDAMEIDYGETVDLVKSGGAISKADM
jgi:hypothetical protein